MILKQLTLRNFCLFRGEHVLDLEPAPVVKGKSFKPIILFGGTNGTGKTTLLDAIQLALYGSRARCSKRLNATYDQFLRQSIHHGVAPSEGAMVAVSFRYVTGGDDHVFEVCRSWSVQSGKIREDLQVYQDGVPDRWFTENWNQSVEELIPLEVAQLFFFDAEKIRSLAEDETSSQVLGAAVKSLLGLDIAERLIADSAVLKARLVKEEGTSKERDEVEALEGKAEDLQRRFVETNQDKASIKPKRERAQTDQRREEETFSTIGGKHWEARKQREQRLGELKNAEAACEAQMFELAASELPLAMVSDLLQGVARQDQREREVVENEIIQDLLRDRDQQLKAVLEETKAPKKVIETVARHLAKDRESRRSIEPGQPKLRLTEASRSILQDLRAQRIEELREEATAAIEKASIVRQEREEIEQLLVATPDEKEINKSLERLKAATERLTSLSEEYKRLDQSSKELKGELDRCRTQIKAIRKNRMHEDFQLEDSQKMLRLVDRTRDVMQEFLAKATERKIDRLSELITESYRHLLQKQSMVRRITIDHESFAIALIDDAGHALPKQRLSEGEKQIFAIAVLWGLARASKQPLPAIIDTPMARLDVSHRNHLVERYLPNASHQVIVLSTDTEVDEHYYTLLKPHVVREYHLAYDEGTRSSVVEAGYFRQLSAVTAS
jgi:DNA sulfur modification protein DndD